MLALAFVASELFGVEPGAELFAEPVVWRLRLEVDAPGMKSLRQESRTYVRATVREGTHVWHDVGVHLKGATGSFRSVDDKPALTLSFDEFVPGQRFHGLSKVHLNNSVEDASYLNEKLGATLFSAGGVPAPRVGHAVVELNQRRLGLYVLKEGFAPEFLALHFARADGTFYDPGAGSEITGSLKGSGGSGGAADGSGLRRLVKATQEPDVTKRWERLGAVLDRERFVSFMALEILSGHRDGYCVARNNYRLYHDPASDRFSFLPSGMDQLLGRAELPVYPHFGGLVAQAVMETSEGRRAYRERLGTVFTNVFQVGILTNRVLGWAAGITRELPKDEARSIRREALEVCERLRRRAVEVARQLALPMPAPVRFENGIATPGGWRPVDEPAGGKLDRVPAPDGRAALHLVAGKATSASWRAKVLLAPGRYRFEGQARTRGLKPLPFGKNNGAALEVSGVRSSRPRWLTGDSGWTKMEVDFEIVGREQEVDLSCGLRAGAGEAWFDLGTLKLRVR